MSTTPIADYALLSDRHSAALVDRDGSVDWLCFPRFDSPSIFGRLLGKDAGHWSIRPIGTTGVTRRYLDRTMVLESTFSTPTGVVTLHDALAAGAGNRGHELGTDAPHLLLRSATCVEGTVELSVAFQPRPEYGSARPVLRQLSGGITASAHGDMFVLSCPKPLHIDRGVASGRMGLGRGERLSFALHYGTHPKTAETLLWSQADMDARLEDTKAAWESWSDLHQSYVGPWRNLVHHSGRVLQSLSFAPTGAICAAATTSLPEVVGGGRNWDYRYAWVRDASFTIQALWVAACPDEANQFFDYVTSAAAGSLDQGGDLPIMFGIGGERKLTERVLPHLEGWRNSAPVRVGNGAWKQRQLDVYGELLSAVSRLSDHLFDSTERRVGPMSDPSRWDAPPKLDSATRRFFVQLADTAATRWREKDRGIWEVRGEPRDFVYSKLMCWVALDRAVTLAEPLQATDRIDAWNISKAAVQDEILTKGWSDRAQAFTQSFGSDDLDASNLMLSLVGFLPGDDPKVLATIAAVEEKLTDERGLVYRYRSQDGLEGEEGVFLLCTFWLAQALAAAGQLARARSVFERATAFVNDVGLLSEEVDPSSGELLGNFPQAFSHIGLVNAAWAISQGERGQAASPRSDLGHPPLP